jgi:hypothetical protein
MLKLKVIACDVMRRELAYLSSLSSCYVDVTYLSRDFHATPDKLRIALDEQIQAANKEFPYNRYGLRPSYDYIILVYGLCDNSIAGLKSERVPMIVPRAHDCITLLLGSRKRYDELFKEHPGTYWYSRGWIECSLQPGEERYIHVYREYVEKYGEDNAGYLMEMEQSWFKSYDQAVFIDWKCLGGGDYYRGYTKTCAEYLKWAFREVDGDFILLQKILNGIFDEEEVLVVPPGVVIEASHTETVIQCGEPVTAQTQ